MIHINSNKIVQFVCANISGCSFYRIRWNAQYLVSFADQTGVMPVITNDILFDKLDKTASFVIEGAFTFIDQIKKLKELQSKFGYKIIYEIDDLVWNIPEYNTATSHQINYYEKVKEVLPYIDRVIVSTEYLKRCFERDFDYHAVHVVPNAVPQFLFNKRKEPIKEKIIKPKVLYTGAPQHFRQPSPIIQLPNGQIQTGITPLYGDWNKEWIDFIIDNVKNDKIEFICFCVIPWFFEEIKDKIKCIPWTDCNSFPDLVMSQNADFYIAPLQDNEFNKCKSNIKLLEASIMGIPFIGDKFLFSPYEYTITNIKDFWKYTEPDEYNKIVQWQYKYIEQTNGYISKEYHLNNLLIGVI